MVHSSNTAIQKRTRQLLVMLARNNRKLPSSVFLKGSNVEELKQLCMGGFGVVYKATYGGMAVVAKGIIKYELDDDELKWVT